MADLPPDLDTNPDDPAVGRADAAAPGTPRWVLVLGIIAVVLWSETSVIASAAAIAADPTTSTDQLLALMPTLPHSVGGLAVLLVIQVLNIYKPHGLTRYGWRKQQEERRALERRKQEQRPSVSA